MDFTRTEEQTLMVEAARKVGERFGLDYWRRIDEEQRFPSEMWKAIAQAGLCGVALPESAGGSGLGMLDLAMVIETLCAT
ncbi:MAG: acyl-CoA dehydrogenase family protein, partial [Burkholderiaceae bacterium]|nr:acyl-CoA dehydrogenase family protein [Burkholderiaceae bacterium]